MTPETLACIRSIDATIMQLQAVRLSLVSSSVDNEPESVESHTTGVGCSHESITHLQTMGELQIAMCPDCDKQWEIEDD